MLNMANQNNMSILTVMVLKIGQSEVCCTAFWFLKAESRYTIHAVFRCLSSDHHCALGKAPQHVYLKLISREKRAWFG